jgi:cell division septal protein FtsQ
MVSKHTKSENKLPFFSLSRILFAVFLILVFYFLFYYNYFQIQKIVVVNSKTISDNAIEKNVLASFLVNRFYVFPGRNIFLFNKKQVATNLKKEFSNIDKLSISRIYPNVLKIKIYEKSPKVIWQSKNEIYFTDISGEVFLKAKSDEIEKMDLPKIQDINNKEVVLFEHVLYPKHINFISKLNEKLPVEGIKISHFEMPAKLADEIHIATNEGWKVYFNTEKDAEAQIANLKLVLADEIKERRSGLDYIDLRIENWVYYKMKTRPTIQQSFNTKQEKR